MISVHGHIMAVHCSASIILVWIRAKTELQSYVEGQQLQWIINSADTLEVTLCKCAAVLPLCAVLL